MYNYCISLPLPMKNSSHAIRSSERDKRRPWIVAVASMCGTQTRMWIVSDDGYQASARAVCVVRLVSTADSRTPNYWQHLAVVTVLLVHALGPNLLIFSFSSGAFPAHNAGGGGYYHYVFSNSQQIFLTTDPNKHALYQEVQCLSYAIAEGFFWRKQAEKNSDVK